MDKPWKVIFAFVAVFIAGAVFGGLFTLRASGKRFAGPPRSEMPRPHPDRDDPRGGAPGLPKGGPGGQAAMAPALLRQITQRLNLTSEQKEKIRPLVNRAAEDLQRIRRESLADSTRVMERMYEDVGAQLTPEQRRELETLRKKMQERVAEERRKRGEALQQEWQKRAERAEAPPAP